MNQQNQVASLAASATPSAVINELSFCKTTTRDLRAWLQRLPKANTGEYSRQLYMALTELSKLRAVPELRIQLLEQIRPETLQLTKQLKINHLLTNSYEQVADSQNKLHTQQIKILQLDYLSFDSLKQAKQSIVPFVESASILSVLWQAGVCYIQGYDLQAPSGNMDYDFGTNS